MNYTPYVLPEVSADTLPPNSLIIPGGIEGIRESIRRDRMRADPALWIRRKLREIPWSRQVEICHSVVKFRRTVVPACFDVGKSWLAARILAWFIDSYPIGEAFGVTTATTYSQVRAILWRELHRAHERGKLPGRLNQTEWMIPRASGAEELVAFGRKPANMSPASLQGIHASRVLAIGDEAAGLVRGLVDALESLTANEDSRLLLIGNPEESGTPFSDAILPGSGYNVIKISAFDSPAYTGESIPKHVASKLISRDYVDERRKKWGEHSPMWKNKILAEVVEDKESGLIKPSWVRSAQNRGDEFLEENAPAPVPTNVVKPGKIKLKISVRPPANSTSSFSRLYPLLGPKFPRSEIKFDARFSFGVDVGEGRDKSTIGLFDSVSKFGAIIYRSAEPNPAVLLQSILEFAILWRPGAILVDMIGIGAGVVGQAKLWRDDVNQPMLIREICKRIHGVKVSEAASEDKEFVNLRAQGCWANSELFRDGLILLDSQDDDLSAQCLDVEYFRNAGRIQIKSKDAMRRDNDGRSPDDYDALMLATMTYLGVRSRRKNGKRRGLTWGGDRSKVQEGSGVQVGA